MLSTLSADALNNGAESLVDVRDRKRFMKEYGPEGVISTRFDYDGLNELVKVTDNKGHVFSATYDNLGRKLSTQHPDAGLTTFAYDLAGNLLRKATAEIHKEIPTAAPFSTNMISTG